MNWYNKITIICLILPFFIVAFGWQSGPIRFLSYLPPLTNFDLKLPQKYKLCQFFFISVKIKASLVILFAGCSLELN